jgi:hypothetical protein
MTAKPDHTATCICRFAPVGGIAAGKPLQDGGNPLQAAGEISSTGVTCGMLCLRKAKNVRKSVPTHSGGVCSFFDEVEKTTNPTPKGSVREPGSHTHPRVNPIEGETS